MKSISDFVALDLVRKEITEAQDNLRPGESAAEGVASAHLEKALALIDKILEG